MNLATLAAILVPLASPAAPPRPSPPAAKDASPYTLDLRLAAFGGAFDGLGVRTDSGGEAVVSAELTPGYASGPLALHLPLEVDHVQTFGADLSETVLRGAIEPEYAISKTLRVGAEAGYEWTNRPGWPDLYQRTSTGFLPPTDRYSHTAWRAGVNLYSRPAAHQHLRFRYRYLSTTYTRDPSFDPATPMHLTPRDNGQHHVDGSWRYRAGDVAFAVRVDAMRREDSVYLARRANSGGSSGNPTQKLNQVQPSFEYERFGLGGSVDLSLQYAYEIQSDPFQGYYSYRGHNPRVVATWQVSKKAEAQLRGELWLRTYGPDSKANTQDGKRLQETRTQLRAGVGYALGRGLTARATAEWRHRTTNYPDYVPGVYPLATSTFDVRWDYDNLEVLAGLEYRL